MVLELVLDLLLGASGTLGWAETWRVCWKFRLYCGPLLVA